MFKMLCNLLFINCSEEKTLPSLGKSLLNFFTQEAGWRLLKPKTSVFTFCSELNQKADKCLQEMRGAFAQNTLCMLMWTETELHEDGRVTWEVVSLWGWLTAESKGECVVFEWCGGVEGGKYSGETPRCRLTPVETGLGASLWKTNGAVWKKALHTRSAPNSNNSGHTI